jgi:cobaltochelatase CobS
MASKASTIHEVDFTTTIVTHTPHGRQMPIKKRFSYLAKVDRIRTLKQLGATFNGSPMHLKDYEINNLFAKIAEREISVGNTSVTFTETPQPQPKVVPAPQKEVPMPTPRTTKPAEGGLDGALRAIVEAVIGDFVPEVPTEEINNTVNGALAPYIGKFDDTIAEVVSLRDIIATLQPKVTEIKLPHGEIRKLDGVQHYQFAKVLANLSERVPTYLVGPAGTGKSTIAEKASQALGLDFYSKSCSSQATESSLLGYMSATGQYVGTGFRTAFEHGGVYLLDEVDNGNANVLTVLNSALANTFMAFPDGMVKRHENFVLVATANTFGHGATAEYVGRNPLDAAFLDRFASVTIGYDNAIEEAMLNAVGLEPNLSAKWLNVVRMARKNVEAYGLRVVVSPRATVHGARMLRHGDAYTMTEVIEATILKGAKPEVAEKVLMGVAI